MTTIAIARGLPAWLLRRMSLAGIALPWKPIYVLPEYAGCDALIRHDLAHIRQIKRDGPIRFTILSLLVRPPRLQGQPLRDRGRYETAPH